MKKNENYMIVKEAKARDTGRGIARVDTTLFEKLNLNTGDIISLQGKKKTACIAWPSYPEDQGKKYLRIDGITRKNIDLGIGEKITIEKAIAKPATKVTFSPTEEIKIVGGEQYLSQILEGRVITRGDLIELTIMGRKIDLVVTKLKSSSDIAMMQPTTQITLTESAVKPGEHKLQHIIYEDIGGLKEEIKQVREMIELPLKHPELFEKMGIEPPKGVLLHGPPGTGKTLIAKAVANESNANFYTLSGPEIISKYYGESEENLRKIFKEATEDSPSIIFIDEIDSIAPKRDETKGDLERRVVAQLLSIMDGLEERGKVIVIGATNRVNALDPALRRPGRFDREIEIGISDKKGRKEILEIHTRGMPLSENVNLDKLAGMTHGYSGADLQALCKEAAIRTLRKIIPDLDFDSDTIPTEILNKLNATKDDFYEAFKSLTPSAMREVVIETPNITWNDIGGLDKIKEELKESVEWPMKYHDIFEHMDAQPPKGILLYGPPGTGKTLLAKAVARESEANFISVKGPEFLSKWVGESEKAVRETFRKARQSSPCIIFFDEIDAITPSRSNGSSDSNVTQRIISQMLTELDGLEELKDVTVIAATNRPDLIDTALLRPGRFDKMLNIGMPDTKARESIIEIHLKNKPIHNDVKIEWLVTETDGYSGADIASVCNQAVMMSIREFIKDHKEINKKEMKKIQVKQKHFKKALNKVKPISKDDVDQYKNIEGEKIETI